MLEHTGPRSADNGEDTLTDLIDQWWETAEERTVYHDGVELIASVRLAQFLTQAGVSVPPESDVVAETRPSSPRGWWRLLLDHLESVGRDLNYGPRRPGASDGEGRG